MKRLSLNVLFAAGFLFTPAAVLAAEYMTIKVSGMVCAFCAQGIKKGFERTGAVSEVKVDLDRHEVNLQLKKDASLSREEITKILTSAGYGVVDIQQETK